jgi:hypothetical protein
MRHSERQPAPALGAARLPDRAAWTGNQFRLRRLPLQRKLAIGATNDPLEAEADRVAQQVMRTPDAGTARPPSITGIASTAFLRRGTVRRCSCGGKCDKCNGSHGSQRNNPDGYEIHGKPSGSAQPAEAPPTVHETLHSDGVPLDSNTLAFMEHRFGHDFSDIQIHTGATAEQSARDIHSHAYAAGNNIVFGPGRYAPQTAEGNRLIAHELTHVIQQSANGVAIQRQPSSLSGLDYEHLCGGQKCYLDDDDLPYARELKEKRQQEQRDEEARANKDDEDEHRALIELRGLLSGHVWYPKDRILDALSKVSGRAINIVRHYGCEIPTRSTKMMAYQKCVITALDRYDADWSKTHGVGGQHAAPLDQAAVQAQQKKEAAYHAGAEGTEYVTGSLAGALGAEITSLFTDDPVKITAGAGIGTALSGSLGSVAAAFGARGSYSPQAEVPWSVQRYRGPAATKEVPPAAPKTKPGADPWANAPSKTPETVESKETEEKTEPSSTAKSGAKRSGINWNPFRGKSLSEYLPATGNRTATSRGRKPVTFKGLSTTGKGGSVWASTDLVNHYHIKDLVTQLMNSNPGRKIAIITGTHGNRRGYTAKEFNFLLQDYGIAPASKDIEFHNAATISDADLKSVLLSGDEVVLAWCESEFSRRIVVALGMNLKKAPF